MKQIGPAESESPSKERLRFRLRAETPTPGTPTPHPWFRVKLHVCQSYDYRMGEHYIESSKLPVSRRLTEKNGCLSHRKD